MIFVSAFVLSISNQLSSSEREVFSAENTLQKTTIFIEFIGRRTSLIKLLYTVEIWHFRKELQLKLNLCIK